MSLFAGVVWVLMMVTSHGATPLINYSDLDWGKCMNTASALNKDTDGSQVFLCVKER